MRGHDKDWFISEVEVVRVDNVAVFSIHLLSEDYEVKIPIYLNYY